MKKIIAMILTILLILFLTCGCDTPIQVQADNESMFITIEKGYDHYIVYNRDTYVMYVVSDGDYNRGNFTIMLNPDGTPQVYAAAR